MEGRCGWSFIGPKKASRDDHRRQGFTNGRYRCYFWKIALRLSIANQPLKSTLSALYRTDFMRIVSTAESKYGTMNQQVQNGNLHISLGRTRALLLDRRNQCDNCRRMSKSLRLSLHKLYVLDLRFGLCVSTRARSDSLDDPEPLNSSRPDGGRGIVMLFHLPMTRNPTQTGALGISK